MSDFSTAMREGQPGEVPPGGVMARRLPGFARRSKRQKKRPSEEGQETAHSGLTEGQAFACLQNVGLGPRIKNTPVIES